MMPGRCRILGILNVTPDSFSGDGIYVNGGVNVLGALAAARRMIAEGADAIDVGGVSTRPGADEVSEAEEARRVLPVVEACRGLPIWVDTSRGSVAREALKLGAVAINDQRAGDDTTMLPVVANAGCPYVIMHNRGTPATMRSLAVYDDVCTEVWGDLKRVGLRAIRAGVRREQLVYDPGIGFAKTAAQSIALLADLPRRTRRPVLIGASRKSFLGAITGRSNPADRLAASLAVAVHAARSGAAWVRVHDVAATRDALAVQAALSAWPGGRP